MVFLIESVIACVLFTLIVVPSVYKNPLAWIADYPPKIRQRAKELGLTKEVESLLTPKVIARKLIAFFIFAVILALITYYANGARGFLNSFAVSYGLWLVVAWYDAFIIDCAWFCHSKKIRIQGTEDLEKEYKNYWFHIKMSMLGSVLGLPACLLAGLFNMLLVKLI